MVEAPASRSEPATALASLSLRLEVNLVLRDVVRDALVASVFGGLPDVDIVTTRIVALAREALGRHESPHPSWRA